MTDHQIFPGVHHLKDELDVCLTLLCGTSAALLVDTGYGVTDVLAEVRKITDLPLTVILTHGHHDHCLGARWFDKALMFEQDQADFTTYTGIDTRKRILHTAEAKGVSAPDDYLTHAYEMPGELQACTFDLGGLTAQVIPCPGHTPGSCVVWVKEYELLLSGDDWNPCTWLFFPSALDIFSYRRNMRELMEKVPFRHVVCSHQPKLYARSDVEAFLNGLTDEAIEQAPCVAMRPNEESHIAQISLPGEQVIVFDKQKAMKAKEST